MSGLPAARVAFHYNTVRPFLPLLGESDEIDVSRVGQGSFAPQTDRSRQPALVLQDPEERGLGTAPVMQAEAGGRGCAPG